jgi:hypothetical protein
MSVGVMKDYRLKLWNLYRIYTSHIHWVGRGTGTPKDRDEVNRREVCELEVQAKPVGLWDLFFLFENSNYNFKGQKKNWKKQNNWRKRKKGSL